MIKNARTSFFLLTCILLNACTNSTSDSTSVNLTIPPSATFLPLATSTQTNIPSPTQRPVYDVGELEELLESSLLVQSLDGLNGHRIRKVTGWSYGFEGDSWAETVQSSYQWLDSDHLMLHVETGGIGYPIPFRGTWPAVINLRSGKVWMPPLDKKWNNLHYLPRWSEELGMLVTTYENDVLAYTSDGELIKTYAGEFSSISPSGTKILLDNDMWVDLVSEKRMDFGWNINPVRDISAFPANWSVNEERVYRCCYHYGDARTGETLYMKPNAISLNGEPIDGLLHVFQGKWIGNNYFLPRHTVNDADPFDTLGFIPLFDASSKTYRNLVEFVGLPPEFNAPYLNLSISPNGDYMIASRPTYPEVYLIDLNSLESQSVSTYANWSPNGEYASIGSQFLSLANKELQALPIGVNYCDTWHPLDGICLSLFTNEQEKQTLQIVDVQNMSVQEVSLLISFNAASWSPDGNTILLTTEDNSLWVIDYSNLESLEQIMLPTPDIKEVLWSPDSAYLSYVLGTDIYIMDVNINR